MRLKECQSAGLPVVLKISTVASQLASAQNEVKPATSKSCHVKWAIAVEFNLHQL
jgi:hypothetical protein